MEFLFVLILPAIWAPRPPAVKWFDQVVRASAADRKTQIIFFVFKHTILQNVQRWGNKSICGCVKVIIMIWRWLNKVNFVGPHRFNVFIKMNQQRDKAVQGKANTLSIVYKLVVLLLSDYTEMLFPYHQTTE